ncbi:MAG: hypothetical protein NVS4B11_34170 [Ktedonobacteraceae bacterium]
MQIQLTRTSLNCARLLLEEGRSEAARTVLESIQADTDKQQRDVIYLWGWYHILSKQWHEAGQTLSPLLTQGENKDIQQETLLERERLAIHLLRLGQAAVNLAYYEDASRHFALCLKMLHDRRVNLPSIRIEARCNLAMTYVMRGSYTVAIQNYEDALRLCRHYELYEALPTIYYGVGKANRCLGDFTKAHEAGREALRIYQENGDVLSQCRMYHVLGRISLLRGDYDASENYYTQSLSLAMSTDSPKLLMLDCAALAALCLEAGRMDAAKEYARRALEVATRAEDAFLCGVVYATAGNVMLAEARLAGDTERQHMFDEGIVWLQKSVTQFKQAQAFKDLAEVYGRLATASEELDRAKEAFSYWKSAYIEIEKAKKRPYVCL